MAANGTQRALGRIEATLDAHERSLSALWKQNGHIVKLAFTILGGIVLNIVMIGISWAVKR